MYTTRIKQLEMELQIEKSKHKTNENDDNPWVKIRFLERKLHENTEFHSQLILENHSLREKNKQLQATEEVANRGNQLIIQKNARLKRLLEDSKTVFESPKQKEQGTFTESEYGLGTERTRGMKDRGSSREVRELLKELSQERSKRTELEGILRRCIEEAQAEKRRWEVGRGGGLTGKERERMIEKLMLEEEVLRILQTYAFPVGVLREYLGRKSSPYSSETPQPRSKSVIRLPKQTMDS